MKINQTNKGKINIELTLQLIVAIILIGWKVIPFFQYSLTGVFWSLSYHAIFALWLLTTTFESGVWFLKLGKYMSAVILWLVYLMLMFFFFSNTQFGFFSLCLSYWESSIMFYYYLKVSRSQRTKNTLLYSSIAMILLATILSTITVSGNALAAREAASGHSTADSMLTGNYCFTAMLTIIFPGVLCFVRQVRSKVIRLLGLILIVLTYVFILKCNLTISILCLIFTTCVYIFLGNQKKKYEWVFLSMLLLIIMFAELSFGFIRTGLISILEFSINIFESQLVQERLHSIVLLLKYNVMTGDLDGRIGLSITSLQTFMKYPIFGIGPQNNANIYFKTYLSMHATLVDDIARYGIVGMGIMINAYSKIIKTVLLNTTVQGKRAYIAGFIGFIAISLLNPTISADVGFALFFILPLLCQYRYKKEL